MRRQDEEESQNAASFRLKPDAATSEGTQGRAKVQRALCIAVHVYTCAGIVGDNQRGPRATCKHMHQPMIQVLDKRLVAGSQLGDTLPRRTLETAQDEVRSWGIPQKPRAPSSQWARKGHVQKTDTRIVGEVSRLQQAGSKTVRA